MTKKPNPMHEIVWNSAEHNIRCTKSDVLVIFDCCHAGALEKNIRSPFKRRAFEYLAATSAQSTTRKPGPESFTTALIWALKDLVARGKMFTTQELVTRILHAPDFPGDQGPRLSERGAACLRRIALEPLNEERIPEANETQSQEEEVGETDDLSLRFVFTEYITEEMVTDLAKELKNVISEGGFKATAILWDGTNSQSFKKHKEWYLANKFANRWWNLTQPCSIEASPHLEPSAPDSFEGNSRIDTPIPNREDAEPIIGEDDGTATELTSFNTPTKQTNAQDRKRKMKSVDATSLTNTSSASSSSSSMPQKRPRRKIGGNGR